MTSGGTKAVRNNRNNDIREAFIKAGLDLFGDYGFEGASTRMLAKKAGANMSGIVYYFGGKDGLYRAVLERIVERFNELTLATRTDIWQRLQEPLDKTQIVDLMKNLIGVMSLVLDDKLIVKNAEKIILREQTGPTEDFAILYDGYIKDVLRLMANLTGQYVGQPVDSDGVVIRAHTLIGQFIAFIATREALLRNLGVRKLKAEQSTLIRQVIVNNVEACLKAWGEEGGQP